MEIKKWLPLALYVMIVGGVIIVGTSRIRQVWQETKEVQKELDQLRSRPEELPNGLLQDRQRERNYQAYRERQLEEARKNYDESDECWGCVSRKSSCGCWQHLGYCPCRP